MDVRHVNLLFRVKKTRGNEPVQLKVCSSLELSTHRRAQAEGVWMGKQIPELVARKRPRAER